MKATRTLSLLKKPKGNTPSLHLVLYFITSQGCDYLLHFHVGMFWSHISMSAPKGHMSGSVSITDSPQWPAQHYAFTHHLCGWTHTQKLPEEINLADGRASAVAILVTPPCWTLKRHNHKAKSHTTAWVRKMPVREMLFTFFNFPILLALSKTIYFLCNSVRFSKLWFTAFERKIKLKRLSSWS